MSYTQLDLSLSQKIHNQKDAPEYVKQAASSEEIVPPATAPSRIFADPVHRLYPFHTATATWMSAKDLTEKLGEHAAQSPEATLLLKAAVLHGNYEDVAQVLSQPPAAPEAPDPAHFAYEKAGSYYAPIATKEMVEKSAEWLFRNAPHMSYAERQGTATKILDAGERLGVAWPEGSLDHLEKHAGRGDFDHAGLHQALIRCELAARQEGVPTHIQSIIKEAIDIFADKDEAEQHGGRFLEEFSCHLNHPPILPDTLYKQAKSAQIAAVQDDWSAPWGRHYSKRAMAELTPDDLLLSLTESEAKEVFPDGISCRPEALVKVAEAADDDRQQLIQLCIDDATEFAKIG